MELMHDAGIDVDADNSDGASDAGRRTRHRDARRRNRRRIAAVMAVAGVVAIVAALSWHPGKHTGTSKSPATSVKSGAVTENTAKPPSTAPGGVGLDPQKTGLPAVPASGGRVRTGTKEQGCFANMREYLDAWDRTGQEPDPCFLPQDPAAQPQPDGVVRSYNGEKF
jgi:hypothetical protein